MPKLKLKNYLFLSILPILAACSSTNSTKINNDSFLDKQEKSNWKLPRQDFYAFFYISKNNIELYKLFSAPPSQEELLTLLSHNEGKDFSDGDSFADCIILRNDGGTSSCLHQDNKNVPKNSIFHKSETLGGMIFLTLLVPYVAVAALGEEDFYVNNSVDQDLINRVGLALRNKIFITRNKITTALKTKSFNNLPKSVKPYGNLIDHSILINAIENTSTLEEIQSIENLIASIDYDGFVVTSPQINQREKPTTKSKVIKKLSKDEIIIPKKIDNEWLYDGDGWFYKNILIEKKEEVAKSLELKRNQLSIEEKQRILLTSKNTSSKDFKALLTESSLLKGISSEKVEEITKNMNALVEQESFLKAKQQNTVDSLSAYLSAYPNGKYLTQAHSLREEQLLIKARSQNSILDFKNFLKAYPSSKHYNEVRSMWFTAASQENTIASYRDFLTGFEFTSFEEKARENWLELVRKKNTVSSYREFLAGYKVGQLEIKAQNDLEPLWLENISNYGNYDELSDFLSLYNNSTYKQKLSYAYKHCPRIAADFFTTKNICVINYLKLDNLQSKNEFFAAAKAFALSGSESDFSKVQTLAQNKNEKAIAEYFALHALRDKNRVFAFSLEDKHEFLGNREHSSWFSQEEGSSSAKIKGVLSLYVKNGGPISVKYGSYNIKVELNLTAFYEKEIRSNWVGNRNSNPTTKNSQTLTFNISSHRTLDKTNYDFGTHQVAYKDIGMMGGYTAQYLSKEIEFTGKVASLEPSTSLKIF